MKAADIFGPVCGCAECQAAGVGQEQTRRDPHTGRILHGWELRRGLIAFQRFQEMARAAVGPRGRQGMMSKLATRKPGAGD